MRNERTNWSPPRYSIQFSFSSLYFYRFVELFNSWIMTYNRGYGINVEMDTQLSKGLISNGWDDLVSRRNGIIWQIQNEHITFNCSTRLPFYSSFHNFKSTAITSARTDLHYTRGNQPPRTRTYGSLRAREMIRFPQLKWNKLAHKLDHMNSEEVELWGSSAQIRWHGICPKVHTF